jgi:hypothetical protein
MSTETTAEDREPGYTAVWQLAETPDFAPNWTATDFARMWRAVHAFAAAAEVESLRAAVERVREAANVTFDDPMVAPASAATAERILRALDGVA